MDQFTDFQRELLQLMIENNNKISSDVVRRLIRSEKDYTRTQCESDLEILVSGGLISEEVIKEDNNKGRPKKYYVIRPINGIKCSYCDNIPDLLICCTSCGKLVCKDHLFRYNYRYYCHDCNISGRICPKCHSPHGYLINTFNFNYICDNHNCVDFNKIKTNKQLYLELQNT